ncbi:uncharacterized protein LOC6651828 [Drosophila willistoni]|nr:uncharacterized protein LOC6651828 [Drosophila willistoni]
MGCITSTNKLQTNENVFRVRVAHLQPRPTGSGSPTTSATTTTRNGYLELTPRELIFLAPGNEPIVWALQHLRRYGLNADLFSFEAGRRCMSGPGIFTFRLSLQNAEQLYPMFQHYINAVNTDVERERVNSAHSVLMGMGGRTRSDVNPHSNNYLEPAPLLARNLNQTDGSHGPSGQQELNTTPDSPDLLSFTPYTNTPTNLYFDQAFRGLSESYSSHQKEDANEVNSSPTTGRTLDRPPQETAPPPAPSSAAMTDSMMHMYANVETPTACNLRDRMIFDLTANSERCYENVSRLDLPLQRESCSSNVSVSAAPAEPNTPTSTAPSCGSGGVNYIVLDLDQPRSPAAVQNSPKTLANGFGSGLSLVSVVATAKTAPVTPEASTNTTNAGLDAQAGGSLQAQSLNSVVAESEPLSMTKTENPSAPTIASSSCTQGYSTIDFIRTYALNKSSTEMPELPPPAHLRHHHQHPHEAEELRITRHSKCIRKAYSISE